MLNDHSEEYFIKGFSRYCCIDRIINADNWESLRTELKKVYKDDYRVIEKRLFDEFKFYNCVLEIEYAITSSLNDFLIKNSLIKDWSVLENKFIEKIKRSERLKTDEEAKEIIKEQTDGETRRILTPHMMLYCAGFGIGELIDYLRAYTNNFLRKNELIEKLTFFNGCRKVMVHNSLTSREDVESKIREGILLRSEIVSLIEEIIEK